VSGSIDNRPFVDLPWCQVVLPDRTGDPFDPLDGFCALIEAEGAELAAELGCPVRFDPVQERNEGTGLCLVGPFDRNPLLREHLRATGRPDPDGPVVWVDRARRLVVIDGPTIGGAGAAFQLLRTAIRTRQAETRLVLPDSAAAVLALVEQEVGDTYPSFALRGIDWRSLVDRHRGAILAEDASLGSLQRLFAGLEDAHTWVRETTANARLPYRAWIDPDRAHFVHVPVWSVAWQEGVRAGDALEGVDRRDFWERTAATPRTRALVAGYRWLAGRAGETRALRVRKPDGRIVEWTETVPALPWREPISWRARESGTGYLRIRGWQFTPEWVGALDAAFAHLAGCQRLLVDVRGNVGGQLIAATHFRDRFLTGETMLGSIQFSIGSGGLGDPSPIIGAPAPGVPGWRKPVRFLIDRQTYSASEDAILGLVGLPYVEIVGEASGGGSGRPRTIWLKDDMYATISTALTFDRSGRCIEGNGIRVDRPLPVEDSIRDPRGHPAADILALADRDWP
jgi:carboxyl-terminal processing protease